MVEPMNWRRSKRAGRDNKMDLGTPWWSRDSKSKDGVGEAGKSGDDNEGEGDEYKGGYDINGDSNEAGAGGMKRRLESSIQALA
jgi:hypothetical protein